MEADASNAGQLGHGSPAKNQPTGEETVVAAARAGESVFCVKC